MKTMPHHLIKTLNEDFKKMDYSQWERSKNTRAVPQKQSEQPWVFLPPALLDTKAPPNLGSLGQEEDSITPSPNTVPHRARPGRTRPNTHIKASAGKTRPNTRDDEPSSLRVSRLQRHNQVDQDPMSQKKRENFKMLRLLMRTRQHSIEELEKHCSALQSSNEALATEIQTTDWLSMCSAGEFLLRHQKLGSSIAAFRGWSQSQSNQAQEELREAKKKAKKEVQRLQHQLNELKGKLVSAQAELHTLKTYKDKEYPVKALRIAEMKREIHKLRNAQQEEQEDISLLCHVEMTSLQKRSHLHQQEVLSGIAKQHASLAPPLVKMMATHNTTMKREIQIHRQEVCELEEKNQSLLQMLQELQLSASSDRKEVFQDIFPKTDKYICKAKYYPIVEFTAIPTDKDTIPRCLPEMNVVLDIPHDKWLPI